MTVQLLLVLFLILGGSVSIAWAVMLTASLKDPLRETNKQERADSRALRKENPMAMKDWPAAIGSAWNKKLNRLKRIGQPSTGRHFRAEGTPPSEVLARALAAYAQ